MARDALVITGATASGKSAVALEVARRLDGEIVSVDSRQVYRGMDIGTAKASLAERALVPHHGLDLVDPDQRYSAGQFARDAGGWIEGIRERGRLPVLVGGTGFFLRALTAPLFAEPPLAGARREALKRWLRELPHAALARMAHTLDPAPPGGVQDRQRLARRVEVALLTGRTLDWWHRHAAPAAPGIEAVVFLLELPREALYRRIDGRVHDMMAAGLLEEVRGLVRRGYHTDAPGMNATGYIELLRHLSGEGTLEEAVVQIQNHTRGFARRQATWFRHQLPANTIRLDARADPGELAGRVVAEWRRIQG